MSAPIVPVAAPAASRLADWAARGRDDQAARAAAIAPTAVSRSGTDSSDDSDAHSYFSDGSSDSEFGRRATNARDRYAAEERARATAAATAAANSDEKIISDWYSRMRRYINYANELYDNIFTAERAVDDAKAPIVKIAKVYTDAAKEESQIAEKMTKMTDSARRELSRLQYRSMLRLEDDIYRAFDTERKAILDLEENINSFAYLVKLVKTDDAHIQDIAAKKARTTTTPDAIKKADLWCTAAKEFAFTTSRILKNHALTLNAAEKARHATAQLSVIQDNIKKIEAARDAQKAAAAPAAAASAVAPASAPDDPAASASRVADWAARGRADQAARAAAINSTTGSTATEAKKIYGGYRQKYLKYKAKYLELKNSL